MTADPRPGLSDEQAAVVQAPPVPVLVRAGAGSGKTHTMAMRVARFVTDPDLLVPADAVLGLTFTRKAATELAERLTTVTERVLADPPDGHRRAPVVATYHAFAGWVVAEFGPHAGVDPDAALLGEAAAAQLADAVVRGWPHPLDVDLTPATVAERVRALAAELAEHDVSVDAAGEALDEAVAVLAEARRERLLAVSTLDGHLRHLRARRSLLPLVEAYGRRKRDLGVVDHGDRIVTALELVRIDAVRRDLRRRHTVVLLDEYQDTSAAQGRLLATAFGGGHPVTAVGDPNQAIFGWRGAGAGTLDRFARLFRSPDGSGPLVLELTVTRRNPRSVLDVANAVAAPLRRAGGAGGVAVLRAPADAAAGRVHLAWATDAAGEAAHAVDWLRRHRRPGRTQAVLCRMRSSFPALRSALEAAGIPVTVVGLGGLLDEPVVSEVVALLSAAHDPDRSAALVRVLTGPRWAMSPRDLDVLAAAARERAATPDEASLADVLADADGRAHGPGAAGSPEVIRGLSPAGRAVARQVARLVAGVRAAATRLPLADAVRDAARASGADVEAAVWSPDPRHPARVLDRFVAVAADFAAAAGVVAGVTGDDAAGAFLAWLEAARRHEWGLETVDVEPDPDAVQLLTVHAAKGLEWDDVVVADLAADSFPARSRSPHWLGGEAVLPWPVRGDRDALPQWPGRRGLAGPGQDGFAAEWRRFTEAAREHATDEERRLAYVAVTRARDGLLLTGSRWRAGRSTPREPSPFLVTARDVPGVVVRQWVDEAEPPPPAEVDDVPWPVSAPPDVHAALVTAADTVLAALAADPATGRTAADPAAGPWDALVDALISERARRPRRLRSVHLTASALVGAAEDPVRAVRDLLRPVPAAPEGRTARGSRFHQWVERRFAAGTLLDLDDLPGAADDDVRDEDLRAFQDRFEASSWARARVVGVEVPFDTPVEAAGRSVRLRGRIDAVVARDDGGLDVVDWKTGAEPRGERARAAAVQLAVYRLAAARLFGVGVEQVRAAFWYAGTGRTVWSDDGLDAAGIASLVARAYDAEPAAGSSSQSSQPPHTSSAMSVAGLVAGLAVGSVAGSEPVGEPPAGASSGTGLRSRAGSSGRTMTTELPDAS
ncbi:MAG: ATP-dependent DNA helicase [Kineosporiaceae bacterium]